jgi:hypothetical protein
MHVKPCNPNVIPQRPCQLSASLLAHPQMALTFANFNFQFDFLLYCFLIVFVHFFHFVTSAYLDQPLSLRERFVYHVKYQPFCFNRFKPLF